MGAFLGFTPATVWSLSPERLVSGKREDYLESRPIKGTRRRDGRADVDLALGLELQQNPKDRAELLMIVDLVRNDLGRVASAGSVHVSELFGRRAYSNVHHLEAVVRSDFPPEKNWSDVLSALLPGGSVTGTPKRRAVEILSRLEPCPRSVYTGALGYISYHGTADFNLPIRTLYHDGSRFYLHSGGGIVADSDPEAEFEESRIKIAHILELLQSC
jgi:para-aminobenzoate synthetase component 1